MVKLSPRSLNESSAEVLGEVVRSFRLPDYTASGNDIFTLAGGSSRIGLEIFGSRPRRFWLSQYRSFLSFFNRSVFPTIHLSQTQTYSSRLFAVRGEEGRVFRRRMKFSVWTSPRLPDISGSGGDADQ
jgi:hypothetical protein